MSDTWRAELADGSTFDESSPALQVDGRSPFRELQRLGEIVRVRAELGLRTVELEAEAEGCPLVSGQAVDLRFALGGEEKRRTCRYRWVCRQEPGRWLWRITDGVGAWEIGTPPGTPGRERMPRPQAGE